MVRIDSNLYSRIFELSFNSNSSLSSHLRPSAAAGAEGPALAAAAERAEEAAVAGDRSRSPGILDGDSMRFTGEQRVMSDF